LARYTQYFPRDAVELIERLGVEEEADALVNAFLSAIEKAERCELDFLYDIQQVGSIREAIWRRCRELERGGLVSGNDCTRMDSYISSLNITMRDSLVKHLERCGCRLRGEIYPP
jgi:hypothetical protein